MRRIAIAFALAWTLTACGGHDEAQEAAARRAKEATEATVESAQHPSVSTGQGAHEDTEVTVESAKTRKQPGEE
jgi:hypothetical protein